MMVLLDPCASPWQIFICYPVGAYKKWSLHKSLIYSGYNSYSLGPLAQLVEHLTFNQVVAGSIPARPTNKAHCYKQIAISTIQLFA